MKLRLYLQVYLIFAVLFGVLIYQKIITVSWTWTWTLGIEFMGAVVIRFIDFADDQHNAKKTKLIEHSMELVKDFSNIVNSEVDLYLYKHIFKLEVKPYPKEFNEHLKNDVYKNIRNSIERRDFYINKVHNEEANVFCIDLKNNIINCIEQRNFINLDLVSSSVGQKRFFNKETIELDILRAIHNNYQASKSIKFKIELNGNLYSLYYYSNIWVVGDDDKELNEIGNIIIKTFNEGISSERFRLLNLYLEEIREDHNQIKKELNKIINNVKYDIPLKGKCKQCSKGGDLWQHTKR